uniref:Uncharacterized protein n=1 Tax=viral metagenome TaxID=1070528 RepID=A0A6C0LSE6_9ZZZZ
MSNYLFGIKFKENNYPVIDKIFLYEGELQFNDQQITGIQGYKTLQDECVDIDCLLNEKIHDIQEDMSNETLDIDETYVLYGNADNVYYGDKVNYENGILSLVNKISNIDDVFKQTKLVEDVIAIKSLETDSVHPSISVVKTQQDIADQILLLEDKKDVVATNPKISDEEKNTAIQRIDDALVQLDSPDNSDGSTTEKGTDAHLAAQQKLAEDQLKIDVKNAITNVLLAKIEQINREAENMNITDPTIIKKIAEVKQKITDVPKTIVETVSGTTDPVVIANAVSETTHTLNNEINKVETEVKGNQIQPQPEPPISLDAKNIIEKQQLIQSTNNEISTPNDKNVNIQFTNVKTNNIMTVTSGVQGALSQDLQQKLNTNMNKFKILKTTLHNKEFKNKEHQGGGPEENMKEFIKLYIGIVEFIIYTPIFYKLTSLTCDKFKIIFNQNIYDGTLSGDTKNKLDSKSLTELYSVLLAFMYVDMSIFNSDELSTNFFIENNTGYRYGQLVEQEKYKLYKSNYYSLKNIKPEQKLIVYISEFIKLLSHLLENKSIEHGDNLNKKYKIYEILLTYIISQYEILEKIVNKYIPLFELRDNVDFRNSIDKYIKEANDENIITYLKIRNDEDKTGIYNDRFNIKMNKQQNTEPNKVMIEYMDDNFPYYKKTQDGGYELSDEIKSMSENQNYDKNEALGTVDIAKYTYKYLFGEFSNIFTPNLSNEEIAQKMDIIKEKIKENKPVFMIGYGASGAGKTSSLIYFKRNKENGILINLCNQLGATEGYTDIELKCKEFYHTTDVNTVEAPMIVNVPADNGSVKFKFENGNFVLSEEYKHTTHHQYRMINKERNGIEKETVFQAGTLIGEVIIHLIDTDRFVKATTNNPNSSRSHTLVFVKLIGKDEEQKEKSGNIIIGDFAGVENTFACENPNTINAFLNVKRDDGKGIPYYSTEAYKGNPDPLGVIETDIKPVDSNRQAAGAKIPEQCISKIESKDPIYNIETPVYRDSWGLSPELKNYYTMNDSKNLKMAFDILLKYLKLGYNGNDMNEKYMGKAEQLRNELQLYSNINEMKQSSNDQPTKNKKSANKQPNDFITIIRNKFYTLLRSIDTANKNKRIRASDKTTSANTNYNKNIIKELTEGINKIIGHISPIQNLPFIDSAFHGQMDGPFYNAYQPLIDDIIKRIDNLYKSVDKLNAILNIYNLPLVEFNNLKTNIFKPHGSFPNLLELIKDLEIETSCRTGNSNVICENRREEGYFINNSLTKVREVIKKILFEKNKESINITPNFIDICFKNYCPHRMNCFSFDTFGNQQTPNTTGSVIFDEIYKELQPQKGYKTPREMYKNIIISIFCVFNISRGANNPPPTPYLDINKFKSIYYFENMFSGNGFEKNQKEFIDQGERIIKMISETFKDKVADLQTINSKSNNTIYNLFVTVITYMKNPSNINKVQQTYNTSYKTYVKELIDMIDNNNAVSAIGTLEFIDQITKFNTIKNTCVANDEKYLQPYLLENFEKTNVMEPLYEKQPQTWNSSVGGKKKYTKRMNKKLLKKRTRRNKKI